MLTVLHNGRIYSPAGPDLSAMIVQDGTISWLGTEDAIPVGPGAAATVIDLDGGLVTPAFVDAHVHCTATGLNLTGLNLHETVSATDLLERVASHARRDPARVMVGSGWDETTWADQRVPTAGELSRAAGGASVYLARVDAHSALVSTELLQPDPIRGDPLGLAGFDASGWVRLQAHDAIREQALARLGPTGRRAAQRAALAHAAALGIASVHEMAGPTISSAEDLRDLLGAGPERTAIEVVGYWAELHGVETAVALGAAGAAGDLFCDGSIGSHTAALRAPFADGRPTGPPRLSAGEVADHVVACTRAGIQAGFHAIGDAAVDRVLDGIDLASGALGPDRVRSAGHRLEHAELVADPVRFGASGVIASMQPGFDATWGAAGGLYERRLGPERTATMNAFAQLSAAGTALAFGSDAPVTALGPWAAVRAAAYHHQHGSALSVRAAFAAHTRGGWRAARRDGDGSGVLSLGAPATYAVWDSGELYIDVPDERVARWSTDPRAALAGLPDLSPGLALPTCRRTVLRGQVLYDAAHPH